MQERACMHVRVFWAGDGGSKFKGDLNLKEIPWQAKASFCHLNDRSLMCAANVSFCMARFLKRGAGAGE